MSTRISLALGIVSLSLIISFVIGLVFGDYITWSTCSDYLLPGTPPPLGMCIHIPIGLKTLAICHGAIIFILAILQTIFAFRAAADKRKILFTKNFAVFNLIISLLIVALICSLVSYVAQAP